MNKAEELNQWLLNQNEVKEYLKYDKLIKEHPELSNLEKEIKELQKEIVNKKHKDEYCDDIIKEYEEKKEIFFSNPIVNNYLLLKEEVNELCQQINNILNNSIRIP
jgi:cell fate (sporulation/competence/biofilm development) regulator YmcA (YheA/YmcA/DUF963 family)